MRLLTHPFSAHVPRGLHVPYGAVFPSLPARNVNPEYQVPPLPPVWTQWPAVKMVSLLTSHPVQCREPLRLMRPITLDGKTSWVSRARGCPCR